MSYPQSESNQLVPFSRRVREVMLMEGLEANLSSLNEYFFPRLIITKSADTLLEIVLIDLNIWKNRLAKSEYANLLLKVADARTKGRRVIIVWEDQWERASRIVTSRIKAILGISVRIPGRLTYVTRIDKNITDDFLKQNHLQGNVLSKYRYGLYLPRRYFRVLPEGWHFANSSTDLLVAAATYSNARIFQKNEKPYRSVELLRFANLINTTVVGGMNKLLSAFEKDFKPDDIMTYADLEWSDGASYRQLGFEAVSDKSPIPFWVDATSYLRFSSRQEEKDLIELINSGSRKFVKAVKHDKNH